MRLCALHFGRYVFIAMCLIAVLRVFLGVLRKDVDFLKRYMRYYNEIKWWEVLWKNFEKICSGIEFILFIFLEMHRNHRIFRFLSSVL